MVPSGPEWFIVLAVVLVIFGGSQLPKLARNIGKAQKEFKDGLGESARRSGHRRPAEVAGRAGVDQPGATYAPTTALVRSSEANSAAGELQPAVGSASAAETATMRYGIRAR